MSKRMLIDASHPEETRVVILSGNRVEEFDFESASRKPLKGNIYLAKVTRVEPSLQAAFVEYGGNRHGFLAFSEIHPDYYQIPVADRQALLAAQRAEERSERVREEAHDDAAAASAEAGADAPVPPPTEGAEDPLPTHAGLAEDSAVLSSDFDPPVLEAATSEQSAATDAPTAPQSFQADVFPVEPEAVAPADGEAASDGNGENGESSIEEIVAETVVAEEVSAGEEDALDEVEERRPSYHRMRHYKIQEVIKKRQILLIQVVKEERGNKGAALTTYLSLAGRYCVLMPNSGRGGGISRKITNAGDRRRLKDAAESLDVPEGMGLIVRTAGASRTKQEIQRDYEYLLRLWDSIRDLTLRSSAPALVYEEGNLIKRALRDQFSKEIEEVVVEGDEGYGEAQGFIKMLMPQQAEAVKQHEGPPALFQKYRVEAQLDSMFNPRVQLRSGGYIVINQTEALVAVDVNSGRSTREHNIEDTALKTNLEAAEEVARQLRLRDLAGLIVIDFIDMEENRNNRSVERRLKDCLRNDRARIQLGRISPFGLLEMSRQRLRPGMVEGSTIACPHCNGTGLIRSVESLALRALRAVEEEAAASRGTEGVTVRLPTEVAVYLLNHKRGDIAGMEERLGISIFVEARADMFGAECEVELGAPNGMRAPRRIQSSTAVSAETALSQMPEASYEESDEDETGGDGSNIEEVGGDGEESRESRPRERGDRRGGRRRRGRDRDRGPREDRPPRETPAAAEGDPMPVIAEANGEAAEVSEEQSGEGGDAAPRTSDRDGGDRRRRRRGRRGGRRNGREGLPPGAPGSEEDGDGEGSSEQVAIEVREESVSAISEFALDEPALPPPTRFEEPAGKQRPAGAAAAIARFFGFRPRENQPEPVAETPAPQRDAAPAAPIFPSEEPPPPAPAPADPAPQIAVEPPPPVIEAARIEETAEAFVAGHDPVPVIDAGARELADALHEPEPVVVMAPPTPDSPADLPYVEPETTPVPTEIIVPPDEKSEIVVIGSGPSGPAKAGWWKKRET